MHQVIKIVHITSYPSKTTSAIIKLFKYVCLFLDDIRKDAQFRQHFQQMCSTIGVDPLASSKGFWSEMLGVGDYYYELGMTQEESGWLLCPV